MASRGGSDKRQRGFIRRRGNSFQVNVYAGVDPLTGKRMYLSESTTDEKKAERILTKLVARVDADRHAKTNATLNVAIGEWLKVSEVEDSTRETYEGYARRYLGPALGSEPVGKISARTLEQFYAELRRCRARCDGRPFVEHRFDGPHECREVKHRRPPGRPPAGGYPPHDCTEAGCTVVECKPHECKPLGNATISKLHFILSGTFSAANKGRRSRSGQNSSRVTHILRRGIRATSVSVNCMPAGLHSKPTRRAHRTCFAGAAASAPGAANRCGANTCAQPGNVRREEPRAPSAPRRSYAALADSRAPAASLRDELRSPLTWPPRRKASARAKGTGRNG